MVSAFSVPDRLYLQVRGKAVARFEVEGDPQIRHAGFWCLRQKEYPLVVFRVLRVAGLNDEVDFRDAGGEPCKFEFALVRSTRIDVHARDPRPPAGVPEAAQDSR